MDARKFQYSQISVTHLGNKLKDKKHIIILIEAEKGFDKIQHVFMIKNSQQSGYRRNISQHDKVHI